MNYQESQKIRQTGFADLMTKKLTSGQGVFRSLGGTVSDKFKAKVKGIKQSFDPLNIAKKLTFGSKLGPAILGKLMGRSKEDIKFFSGIKGSMKKEADQGDSASKLGEIYKLMVDLESKKRIDQELTKSFQREKSEEDDKRNQEIIQALTSRKPTKKKRKDKEEVDAKKKEEESEKEKKKLDSKSKKKSDQIEQKAQQSTKKAEKEAEQITSKSPKITEKVTEETPLPKGKIASRAAQAANKTSTAARIAAPVAIVAAGATLGISSAIAGGESNRAGGYNAANKGTKNGKIIAVDKPIDLEHMTIGEIMRRQAINWGDPNESEKLFAVGKYQMITGTLADAVRAMPSINKSDKFDGPLQEKIFKEFLIGKKNPAIANYLNSPVDDPKLLHAALKSMSNEWASVADPDIPGGKTSHYGAGNKASITVDQATASLKSDREKLQKSNLQTQQQTTPPNVAGASAENTALRKEMDRSSSGGSSTTNNNNYISSSQGQPQSRGPKESDRSAMEQKGKQ